MDAGAVDTGAVDALLAPPSRFLLRCDGPGAPEPCRRLGFWDGAAALELGRDWERRGGGGDPKRSSESRRDWGTAVGRLERRWGACWLGGGAVGKRTLVQAKLGMSSLREVPRSHQGTSTSMFHTPRRVWRVSDWKRPLIQSCEWRRRMGRMLWFREVSGAVCGLVRRMRQKRAS